MKLALAGVVLALFMAGSVAKSEEPFRFRTMGMGNSSCGTWISARPHGSSSWQSLGFEQWVLGFLTGISAMGFMTKLDPLNGVDGEAIWAWMDNYCKAHPLENIGNAAIDFVGAHPR